MIKGIVVHGESILLILDRNLVFSRRLDESTVEEGTFSLAPPQSLPNRHSSDKQFINSHSKD
jgi:hypothetical protein